MFIMAYQQALSLLVIRLNRYYFKKTCDKDVTRGIMNSIYRYMSIGE